MLFRLKSSISTAILGFALLGGLSRAQAQTQIWFEGFEGLFPDVTESVGDANLTGTPAYWDDVDFSFGGEGTHSGGWKGYCAAVGNAGTPAAPQYQPYMAAFLNRNVNLAGYTGANLRFWYKIPGIETCGSCEFCRVFVDGTQVWVMNTPVTDWTEAAISLNGYLGASHTIRFEFDSDLSVQYEGWYLDDILVEGATTGTTDNLEQMFVSNYSGYVIDSDAGVPGYNRDTIQATSIVRSENFSGAPTADGYVLTYRLLDAGTGLPFPIYDSTGVTNISYTCNVTNSIPLAIAAAVETTNVTGLKPAARLNPYSQYTVELKVFKGGAFTGMTLTDGPRGYLHFTNTVSGDVAVNTIAVLDTGSYTRTNFVNTVPGKDAIAVDVDYILNRYDDFNGPIGNDNVTVHLNYRLVDVASNNDVPLATSTATFVESVQNYFFFFFKAPTAPAFAHTLQIKPATGQQLDSVNKLYKVIVSIDHVEINSQPPVAGNSLTLANQQFLHFNGNLLFGPILTRFTSIASDPPTGPTSAPLFVASSLAVDANSGYVVGKSPASYYFGSGLALNVNLRPNGDAIFTGPAGGIPLFGPTPDTDVVHNVRYSRGPINLDVGGATSDVQAILPTGFGYNTDPTSRILSGKVDFGVTALAQDLSPATDPSFAPAVGLFACEETKPFWIQASSMLWKVNSGLFVLAPTGILYVRQQELSSLEAAGPLLKDPDMQFKRSNEQYFRFLNSISSPQVVVETDGNGSALMSATVTFTSSAGVPLSGFITHFPYDVLLKWAGNGQMQITQDQVDPVNGMLTSVRPVGLPYNRDCNDETNCPGPIGPETLTLNLAADLHFTTDGGLIGGGVLATNSPLHWGHLPSPPAPAPPNEKYAQRTTLFGESKFHMPGLFLRGDQTSLNQKERPAVILFTGIAETNLSYIERPETPAYSDGFADYAGLNFRVYTDGAKQAECVMAGVPSGLWPLTGRSKYYLRQAGVSGIHEAVFGSFPTNAVLYGYNVNFSNYGLSYLDSEVHDSRTEGYVTIPYPSNFKQEFSELKFSCMGALTSAKVPAVSTNKVLEYWQADFLPLAINFQAPVTGACDPSQAKLTLGVKAWASHLDQPLYGKLGFDTNGNLITKAYAVANSYSNLDSRLDVPNNFKVKGPAGEEYNFTCVSKAYYNNWLNLPTAQGGNPSGFINLAGKLDVPFFEDLKAHFQTSAQQSNTTAPIYLMGGWPKGSEATHGWEISGNHFFNTAFFDDDNVSFPGSGAAGLDGYRNSTNEQYHVRAQQRWLGVVDFDYPLSWSSSTRSFKSFQPATNNLLVVTAVHQVKYLSAQHAELAFGIQYAGLPQINLANIAFNAIDDATGVAHAFIDAGLDTLRQPIDNGLNSLNDMLNAQMHAFFENTLQQFVDPVIDQLYDDLKSVPTSVNWSADVTNIVNTHIISGSTSNLQSQLQKIAGDVTGALGIIGEAKNKLDDVDDALASVQQLLAADGSGARNPLRSLTKSLVGDLAAQFISLATDSAIDDLLKNVAPQLNAVTNTIGDLDAVVKDLESKLAPAQEFSDELKANIAGLLSEVTNISYNVQSDLNSILTNLSVNVSLSVTNPLQEYSPEDIKKQIRHKIEDEFFGSKIATTVQVTVKQRLYDVDAAIRESIDSAFQQLNEVVKDMINTSLADLDKSINKMLDDVSDVMGAGEIKGYAHIDGDSLKLLRLDGHFKWSVPDDMEFKAYLQIKELDSDGTDGCLGKGEKATEVTVGAQDIQVQWISPDLRANIGGKFSFRTSPSFAVMGMGGSFELTGGLKFEAFEIAELGAAMAFGQEENYLACKARVKFNKYEFAGGLFFGRTCTIDPLLLVDPDVANVLGMPPFTGAYVYAEGWIPLNEFIGIPSSCFFNIKAGIGAGVFYFVEGPTFGGKALLGLSGEVLCIVSVKGEVKMVGVKQGGDLTLKGTGTLSGEIGVCPFCIDFSKSVGLKYKNGSFDVDF
ncbi:MAG TPA: hypothetical protein VLU94_00470 [Candidatus Nitrosotalea sp.]|nr:hypothetical protein [Candidatus Nitrosotalea sp.]